MAKLTSKPRAGIAAGTAAVVVVVAVVAVGGLYALDRIDDAADRSAQAQVQTQVNVQEALAEQIARVEAAADRGPRRVAFLDAVAVSVAAARSHLDDARGWLDQHPQHRFDRTDRRDWNNAAAGYQDAVLTLGGLMPDYCGGEHSRSDAISKMLRPDEHGAVYTTAPPGGVIAPAANLVTCYERSAEVAAAVM